MPRRDFRARAALGTALLLAMGSCASTPKPVPVAPPSPASPVAASAVAAVPPLVPVAQTREWDELPVIEGGWSYDSARRIARFVDDSGLERASLTCVAPTRTMRLVLAAETATNAVILTSAGQNPIALTGGASEIAVGDIALDRMAFSRGRFGLRASTLMVLPVQAEIGRVIEDCRG